MTTYRNNESAKKSVEKRVEDCNLQLNLFTMERSTSNPDDFEGIRKFFPSINAI
jgi:hypothetical protein